MPGATASAANLIIRMITTYKLPRNTTKKGDKNLRGEALLPHLSGNSISGFVGMKTGRTYERGYVVHIGIPLSPETLLNDYCENNTPPDDREIALERIVAFIQALEACKVGNLLSISYTADGLPLLKIEQEYLLTKPNPKLP